MMVCSIYTALYKLTNVPLISNRHYLQIDDLFPREVGGIGGRGDISHLGFGFLLRESEIGTETLAKQFAFGTPDLADYIRHVAMLLLKTTAKGDIRLERGNGFVVAGFHLGCNACRLQFMEDHPAAYLVQQDGLDTTVERIDPRLVVLRGMPYGDDLVAVLIEMHVGADRIGRTAPETVVALYPEPRVVYQTHS